MTAAPHLKLLLAVRTGDPHRGGGGVLPAMMNVGVRFIVPGWTSIVDRFLPLARAVNLVDNLARGG